MTDAPFEDQLVRMINFHLFRLGIAACAAIIILAAAVTVVALRPKTPPYVVALDHGRIVGYAHTFSGSDEIAPQVIEDRLREFIYDARVITTDHELELHNIHTAYAIARGQATRVLEAYYQTNPDDDPIKLGYKGAWRDVHIIRCLREPEPDTWRVEWNETLYLRLGNPVTSNWEANMKTIIGPPDASNDLNPVGVYVINLNLRQAEGQ
jgi:type IV secretory pathway TrbF-like protein